MALTRKKLTHTVKQSPAATSGTSRLARAAEDSLSRNAKQPQDLQHKQANLGLLDRFQIAEEFGVSVRTIDRLRALRKFAPAVRVGRKVLWRRETLAEFLAQTEEEIPVRRARGRR